MKSAILLFLATTSIIGQAYSAEEPQRIGLWNGRAALGEGRMEEKEVWLTVHRPAQPNGTAVVICPGGGYAGHAVQPEGHGIAAWLNRHGIIGVVLEYRLPAGRHQVPLLDAQRAIRTVRSHAQDWKIDPARIGIIGFSAGGHLASTAATHFDDGNPSATDPVDRISCRPDFAILVYPVVTMGEKTHGGSKRNLLGADPTPELIKHFSNELQVTERTPPMFLAHAVDDKPVPPENSRMLFDALQARKIPSKYLELPSGGHGLDGYKGPMWDAWQTQSLAWLAELKFVPPTESNDKGLGTDGNGNFVIGPEYKIDPDLTDKGNPKGKSFEFSLRLADSKIFPGTDSTLDPTKAVRERRKVFVYVPAAYKDGDKAPILVTLDGPSRLDLVCYALDNLTVSTDPNRTLPAFIVIAVENGGNDGKGSERGLEYDTMSDRFARFINDEVLPAVLANAEVKAAYPHIAFTQDPWGKAVMGCSSGGAAALTMCWFLPDLFRRLITYSGTFVDQQDDDAPEEAKYPLGAWEYHSSMKLIETSEKKPLRIFTHVSENDNRAQDPEETYHNWVMANERTAKALAAKGYDYRYVFSRASKHCDGNVFEQTLADTLVWMWRGYRAE